MEFLSKPYKYQFFKKNRPIYLPAGSILCPFMGKIIQFSKNSGFNLIKFWEINLPIYNILHFIKNHLYTKTMILLLMLVVHSRTTIVLSTPPPPKIALSRGEISPPPLSVISSLIHISESSYIQNYILLALHLVL